MEVWVYEDPNLILGRNKNIWNRWSQADILLRMLSCSFGFFAPSVLSVKVVTYVHCLVHIRRKQWENDHQCIGAALVDSYSL